MSEVGQDLRVDRARGLSRLRAVRWTVVGPVLVYVLLVLCGVTQSSIGIDGLRQDPDDPHGLMIGEPRSVRSDEFLTSTPLGIGVTASGRVDDLNPLSAPQGFLTQLPTGPVSALVLVDGTALLAGQLLPDQMLVAARWWLPFLLLALGCPAFVRRLTGNPWMGWFLFAVLVLNPATVWWSFNTLPILGFTIAGAAALQLARERLGEGRRAATVAWGLLSAVLLARVPLLYQPWMLVLAPAILLATVAGLLAPKAHRGRAVMLVVAVGAVSLALLGGVLVENRDALQAVLDTAYPGHRVSTGDRQPIEELFAATSLHVLDGDPTVVAANQSELSSAYAVSLVWALVLLLARRRFRDRPQAVTVVVLALGTAFWVAWSTLSFGTLGERVPGVNLVPPQRSADVLGYLGLVLCALVLGSASARATDLAGRLAPVLAAVPVAGLSLWAGLVLRDRQIPSLSVAAVVVSSLLVGLVVLLITWRPRRRAGYVVAAALAAVLAGTVNPVLLGLGDLRESPSARLMLRAGDDARDAGELWVSDDPFVDTLMVATGVPSLSGRQLAGPDKDAWERLAPDVDPDVWNRGGAYIWFRWSDQPGELDVSSPQADVIIVQADPCTLAEREPDLRRVVSTAKLDAPCLRRTETFRWGGALRYVYSIRGRADRA